MLFRLAGHDENRIRNIPNAKEIVSLMHYVAVNKLATFFITYISFI